jgi:hypothetical protein
MMVGLLVAWGVNRKSQIRSAYLLEADMLVSDIIGKEKIVYAAKAVYGEVEPLSSSGTDFYKLGGLEDVDARRNQYFKTFKVVVGSSQNFTITVYGAENTEVQGLKRIIYYDGKTDTKTPLTE